MALQHAPPRAYAKWTKASQKTARSKARKEFEKAGQPVPAWCQRRGGEPYEVAAPDRKTRRPSTGAPTPPPLPPKPLPVPTTVRQGIQAAMVLAIAAALATLNWALLSAPLAGMVTGLTGQQAAVIVVLAEVFACMIFMDAIGRTHMIRLIAEAGYWRIAFGAAGFMLMAVLIAIEVGMGDIRDVAHQVALMTQATLGGGEGSSDGVAKLDALTASHAWIATYVQRGLGVILPLLNMFAVMPLETLVDAFCGSKPPTLPIPAPRPVAAPVARPGLLRRLAHLPWGKAAA